MSTTSPRIFGETKESEISGYLQKGTNKAWTKYWCVLKDSSFNFYKSKVDSTPQGQIKVLGCEFEKMDYNTFRIISPERTYYFQGIGNIDEWIQILTMISKLSKKKLNVVDNSQFSDTKFKTIKDSISNFVNTKRLQNVSIRSGKYVEKEIVVTKNLEMEGIAKDVLLEIEKFHLKSSEIILLKNLQFQNSLIRIDAGFCKIQGCTFIGSSIEMANEALCEIVSCVFQDIENTFGINLSHNSKVQIIDCKFNNFENAIQVFDDAECLCESCVFSSKTGNAIFTNSSKNITISKTKFVGNVLEVTHPNLILIQNDFTSI